MGPKVLQLCNSMQFHLHKRIPLASIGFTMVSSCKVWKHTSSYTDMYCVQIQRLGYEPVVVLSQADRECTACRTDTLGDHAALNDLKNKVKTQY